MTMEWKQNIYNQLRERNRQERDIYAEVVKHYNRLIENYSIILLRCTDQEHDILKLRQENNELQLKRIPISDHPNDDKYEALKTALAKAKDETLTLLRERGDMTKEVINLSRIIKERDEKLYAEENKNQMLTKENTSLKQRLDTAEEKLNSLQRVNETIHDEFQALQLAYTQLEKRQLELDATNAILRREMTKKFEIQCSELDQEVKDHEKRIENDIRQKLDAAKNDVTTSSIATIA